MKWEQVLSFRMQTRQKAYENSRNYTDPKLRGGDNEMKWKLMLALKSPFESE